MKTKSPKIKIRIPQSFRQTMLDDLRRPHSFAFERVGFVQTRSKKLRSGLILITVVGYQSVADDEYIQDDSVGARINSSAIRNAMQMILDNECGCFHVHLHDHCGEPEPSTVDKKGLPGIVESFGHVSTEPHGILILSEDSVFASVKLAGSDPYLAPALISFVGYPMKFVLPGRKPIPAHTMYDRQSFLGDDAQFLFEQVKVGIIGFGGGGSHIGQQLAHLGVKNIVVFDADVIEDTNHNRLVGAWHADIKNATKKTSIAKRVISKISPHANLVCIPAVWQDHADEVKECDIVIGGVDSFLGRRDLEAECRRYLTGLIDIGMDVHAVEDHPPHMSGQVILSMPGMACMHCFGFLTEEKLHREGAKYGNAGGRPQVIWANGTLASTAVGLFVDLVTGWTNQKDRLVYLAYDGNLQTMSAHIRALYAPKECTHYPLDQTGPPRFKRL